MKRVQRTLTAALATAALAGSFALSVHAQPASAPTATTEQAAPQKGQRSQSKDMAQHHAQRSERMKTMLQLQPNQQAAWEQYVQATTPMKRSPAAGARTDLRTLTTPERLDLAQKLRKDRTTQAEQREQVTRSFYAALNTSQKKAFDALTVQHAGKHQSGHGHSAQRKGHHAPQPTQAAQTPAA